MYAHHELLHSVGNPVRCGNFDHVTVVTIGIDGILKVGRSREVQFARCHVYCEKWSIGTGFRIGGDVVGIKIRGVGEEGSRVVLELGETGIGENGLMIPPQAIAKNIGGPGIRFSTGIGKRRTHS